MKKILINWIIVLVCCMFTACFSEYQNPLSDSQNAIIDKNLLGIWVTTDKVGEIYFQVNVDKDNNHLLKVDSKKVNKKDKSVEMGEMSIFTTNSNNLKYMNIKGLKNGKLDEFYSIAKYEIIGNKLKIYFIEEQLLEQAIDSGNIQGVYKKTTLFDKIKISDTSYNILRFFESNKNMFYMGTEFQKVK